jgi:tRNA(fMet)-specific endonuclease VapC
VFTGRSWIQGKYYEITKILSTIDFDANGRIVGIPQGKVAARIAHVGEESVCTSIIVAGELRYGAARKGSARLLAQLLTVLDAFEILPFETPAEITYGDLRARLEVTGKPIAGNDMLITAHAVSLGHTMVTNNEREFSRVDGLPVENWLRF